MVAVTAVALVAAGAVGTFLQLVVFDLEEQESLGRAGVLGYLAGVGLLISIAAPAVAGIVLGLRARRLGERRRGTTGVVVNLLVAVYLAVPAVAFLLFG
jgi:hypothetical protein